MTATAEHFKSQLGTLSAEDRSELAYYLLTSLEQADNGVAEAWREEIARRVAEIRSGRAVGQPADELMAELREKYP